MGKHIQGFGGMKQDVSENASSPKYYFESRNMTIYPDKKSRLGGIGNIKSNSLVVDVDAVGEVYINGGIEIDNGIVILFVYNNGVNRIIKVTDTQEVIYEGDLGIAATDKISIVHNIETEAINKIYWSNNGKQQIRSINIDDPELSSLPLDKLDIVSELQLGTMTVENAGWGGTHTSGMIQYAYSYFNLHGQESAVSPLSAITSLTKSDNQGGNVNQLVGQINKVSLTGLDSSYDYIRIYSIKYNTQYEEPIISIISESNVGLGELSINDDGSVISNISIEQFTFLGGTIFYPKTIEVKDNRLFAANIKEDGWDVFPYMDGDTPRLDARAYRHNADGHALIKDGDSEIIISPDYNVALDDDVIQLDFDTYCRMSNGELGAEGKYIKIAFVSGLSPTQNLDLLYKAREVYRFGIQFINKYGAKSSVQWICDFRVDNNLYVPTLTIKPEGITEFASAGAVGYQVVRVERTATDRSVLFQGVASGCMMTHFGDKSNESGIATDVNYAAAGHSLGFQEREEKVKNNTIYPTLISRNFKSSYVNDNYYTALSKYKHLQSMNNENDVVAGQSGDDIYGQSTLDAKPNPLISSFQTNIPEVHLHAGGGIDKLYSLQNTKVWQIHSPEILFSDITEIPSGAKVRIVGFRKKQKDCIQTYAEKYKGLTTITSIETTDVGNYSFQGIEDLKFHAKGFVGMAENESAFNYVYKKSLSSFHFLNPKTSGITEYDIYGTPLIMEQGETVKAYNNNSNYKIANNLYDFTDNDWDIGDTRIRSINAEGTRCCYIIPIDPNENKSSLKDSDHLKHLRLEDAFNFFNSMDQYGDPIVELYIPVENINLYGGNTYEARSLNTYAPIGEYATLDQEAPLNNTGDIREQAFCYQRFTPGSLGVDTDEVLHHSEIVDTVLETSVDMVKRNDLTSSLEVFNQINQLSTRSLSQYRSESYDTFHNYNTVYSRMGNAITNTPRYYLQDDNKSFPNLIRSSKVKVGGDTIDAFTDFLVNEEATLGAKYGEITKLHIFNDNLYVFTRNSIYYQGINPRVQVIGDDSIAVELGTGSLFGKDKALSTDSGLEFLDINSVINTPSGIYYFDRNNIAIGKVNDKVVGLSAIKGNHNTLLNTFVSDGRAVVSGYDAIVNSVYITLPVTDGYDTILFNEAYDEFISWISSTPNIYIKGRGSLYTIKGSELWKDRAGEGFNNLYGEQVDSEITFIVKPQEGTSARYDSIEWKSVIDGINNSTFNMMSVYNEDQASGLVTLNALNKYNSFRVNVPRHANNQFGNRMNGKWMYVRLIMESNTDNEDKEMILHNLSVNYTNKL